MATLHYDGSTFDEADLADALSAAAKGQPKTDREDLIHDGKAWADGLLAAALASPLRAAAERCIGQMLQAADPEERDLAVSLQYSHQAASGADTLQALTLLHEQGHHNAAALLAASLDQLVEQKRFSYTQALRSFANDHATKKALMRLYFRHDRPWVIAQLKSLFPADVSKALSLVANGIAGFSLAEVESLAADLGPAFATLPTEVAKSLRDYLAKRVASAKEKG